MELCPAPKTSGTRLPLPQELDLILLWKLIFSLGQIQHPLQLLLTATGLGMTELQA